MNFEDFKKIHAFLTSQLKGSPYEGITYYVGGCMRDMMLQREINDIDICVACPNGGIELAKYLTKKLNVYEEKTNPVIFEEFGTAKFRFKGALPEYGNIEFETVQTRKEAYRDSESRKPETCFGTLTEDALRRDLTINSLYFNITQGVCLDMLPNTPCEGDLLKHKLRAANDPNISFSDDALRILRVIRFAAVLGWGIEPKTWVGMCCNVHRLSTISKERIHEELNKIIVSSHADEGIRKLYYCGALKYIFPEMEKLKGMTQGRCHNQDAFEHSLSVMMKMPAKIDYRLAGLLHDIGKSTTRSFGYTGLVHFNRHENVGEDMVKELLTALKYPNSIVKIVAKAVRNHMRFKQQQTSPSKSSVRKFINEMTNDEELDLCLELIDADNKSHAPKHCKPEQVNNIRKIIKKLEEDDSAKVYLPINGKDIMEIFKLKKGPKVGSAIRLLTEFYYIRPKMTKEEAIQVIQRAIDKGEL